MYGSDERLVLEKYACKRLKREFGLNISSVPNYRIVRASGRREWREGEWRPKYDCAVFADEKYKDPWILEKWCPPEQYGSKTEWNASGLGPFPVKGDYEVIHYFPDVDSFSEEMMDFICKGLFVSKGVTKRDRFQYIKDQEEKARQQKVEEVKQAYRDAKPLNETSIPQRYQDLAAGKPTADTLAPNMSQKLNDMRGTTIQIGE